MMVDDVQVNGVHRATALGTVKLIQCYIVQGVTKTTTKTMFYYTIFNDYSQASSAIALRIL